MTHNTGLSPKAKRAIKRAMENWERVNQKRKSSKLKRKNENTKREDRGA